MFGDEMILGTETRKLDVKGRFFVPKDSTGAEIGDTLIFVKREKFIEIWNSDKVKKEVRRLKECLDKATDMKAIKYYQNNLNEIYSSILGGKINKVDNAGRILLGADLVKMYNLNEEIYLEGANECLRVWNSENFLEYQKQNMEEHEKKNSRL